MKHLCPCHSGKAFARCCEPFLNVSATPRSVTQLMRSRYSAYALGGFGDYLYRTWHPHSRGALQAEDLDADTLEWTGLQIVASQQHGDEGWVEFIAHFRQEDGSQSIHHEHSRFLREKGQWRYYEGRDCLTQDDSL